MLAGSASYDPKNYNGLGEYDLVPTKLIDTVATETASDDWFADFNMDGIAEMAVGRLPTPTSEEAQTTVMKLAVYDNSASLNSALLVADGNLNFDKGDPFANVIKATVETEVKWRNFGFFGRGSAFYDFDLHDSDKLGPTGRDRLGKNVVGLDGFVYAGFEPMGKNLRVRIGRQVISWGESTFIPNGINIINPVDLSKIRIPGSELKEAFIPTNAVWASQELTKSATVEAFYLLNHDKVRLDPRGSYFSNNDFASDDSTQVFLTFGRRRDQHFPLSNPIGALPTSAAPPRPVGPFDRPHGLARAPRRDPSDDGQYGAHYVTSRTTNARVRLLSHQYHSSSVLLGTTVPGTASNA